VIRRAASLPHALFALRLAATALYAVTGDGAIRNVIQVGAVSAMAIHTLRRRDARTRRPSRRGSTR